VFIFMFMFMFEVFWTIGLTIVSLLVLGFNVFVIFLMGVTIQDSSKREKSDTDNKIWTISNT